ncbi:MAG TPA: hypothetical protein VN231_14415 [Allosphingosinicella sp.]|nr:hypothetical protein [Allosphingosinicella sp.]
MAQDFPRSPKVLKGGIVAYQLPQLFPTVIVFQYNPEEVSRSIQGRGAGQGGGGGRGDANRVNGPPQETITLSVEIDAADQLERPGENGVTVANGLHPVIASLERLMHPPYPLVIANEALALGGSALVLAEQAPLSLLIWGPRRVLPVQVQSLSIKEEAFDQKLNPIRAKADLTLNVLTYRDLDVTNPGYWVYLTAFTQKEVMAALNTFGDSSGLRALAAI